MKTVGIALARMGSTRVPGKVMRLLNGEPVLKWVVDALQAAAGVDEVVLATSTLPADDVIEEYCHNNHIICCRGSETDVLDRFYQSALIRKAAIVIRVTCDCPFLDPNVIGEVIKLREMTGADYASNIDPPTYPDGLDIECFTFAALEAAWKEATRATDRDCVTTFISRNRSRFKAANLTCPLPGLVKERWVLDTEKDWLLCKEIASHVRNANSYLDVLRFLDTYPADLRRINAGAIRNERFYEGLATEQLPARTFERSQGIFERAIKTIPFAAQTFSKSHLQFPAGKAPLYVSHADGARIFDVDGNDYVDLVSALLPVVLGYRDPDVDYAVRCHLDRGISFSLATELEYELSETLCRIIPCAEMVKFGKSGTDVTTAAVRLARAYTGRDHVLVGGYHGWADWSMSVSERNLGIPEDVRKLSHRIDYGKNDLKLNRLPSGKFPAAIIVEPNDDPEYLTWLREWCDETGTILIFDEIITGFRYGLGGAQELYDVTPDLATFGKSMANGMPISALVGRRDIMKKMQPPDNIFYSGTFFGETLSIAAAIATIKKLEECNVVDHLLKAGISLERRILSILKDWKLTEYIKIDGWYPNQKLTFFDAPNATKDQIRTLFMQEMAQEGVLIIASNNLSFAHKEPELSRIRLAYERVLLKIADCLRLGNIAERIGNSVVATAPLRATA